MPKVSPITTYGLSDLEMTRKILRNKPDSIVNALRSAVNNGKQLSFEVIQWITSKKDSLMKQLLDVNNIKWLQDMLLSWQKQSS
jgi:flagellar biosynthesis/type III secretory pathway chaperone